LKGSENLEECLQSDACEPSFQMQALSVLLQNKGMRRTVGRVKVKKEMVIMLVKAQTLQYVDTLLDSMGQWGFEYSDIAAMRKIQFVMRSINSSVKTIITYYHICENKSSV